MPNTVDAGKVHSLKADLGEETARSLIVGFVEEVEARVAVLAKAHAAGDSAEIRAAAHAVRSVCLEYGATALADMAKAIEAGGPVDLAALEACRDRTLTAIKALIGLPAG